MVAGNGMNGLDRGCAYIKTLRVRSEGWGRWGSDRSTGWGID